MEKHSLKKGIKVIHFLNYCSVKDGNDIGKDLQRGSVQFHYRYNEDLELEDAIHTAILTLKVSAASLNNLIYQIAQNKI